MYRQIHTHLRIRHGVQRAKMIKEAGRQGKVLLLLVGLWSFGGFAFAILHEKKKKKKKENYGIFFLETERRKCVTRVLQRMVGRKLLRGKKGFGGGGRDDDDDPRPKFARRFPSFFRPKASGIVHRTNPQPPVIPQSPTIIHRMETIFLPELQKSHYRPPDGDLLLQKVPVMPTGRTDPLPPESPGIVRRTETLFLLPELAPSPGFWELCRARHRSSSGKSSGGHETSRVCIWTRG